MRKFSSRDIRGFVSKPLFDEDVILNRDNSWPRISIVTPSLNQGEYLERTILSVLNQNYPNLEYIVIDGGSTDGSLEIINKYERYLDYWVSEPDRGQSHAINKGFGMATGDLYSYLNADDTYNPGTLEIVSSRFHRNRGIDLFFGNVLYIDEKTEIVGECRFTRFNFVNMIYEGGSLHQPSSFWKKELYEEVKGFDEQFYFCMDYDFFCKAGVRGKFLHIREYLASFRIHGQSKSSNFMETGELEHESIAVRYRRTENETLIKLIKFFCLARRFFLYIWQGDFDYAIKGLINRILNSPNR